MENGCTCYLSAAELGFLGVLEQVVFPELVNWIQLFLAQLWCCCRIHGPVDGVLHNAGDFLCNLHKQVLAERRVYYVASWVLGHGIDHEVFGQCCFG